MRQAAGILAALFAAQALWASANPPERRLFDFERREGDPRPKLTPPFPSPRGEGKGEGAVTPSPAGKGPGVRSVHPSPGLSPQRREVRKSPGWQQVDGNIRSAGKILRNGVTMLQTSGMNP